MKYLSLLLTSLFFLPTTSLASSAYATTNGSASQVQLAIQATYGSGAGVGAKEGSCLLCHNSASGGPGNINSGFGTDFVTAAGVIGASSNGGGSQSLAVLTSIFAESAFAAKDSDSDGQSNSTEMQQNNDPASNITGSGGGGGGGCGMIQPTNKPPFNGLLLLLLPFLLIFTLPRKTAQT